MGAAPPSAARSSSATLLPARGGKDARLRLWVPGRTAPRLAQHPSILSYPYHLSSQRVLSAMLRHGDDVAEMDVPQAQASRAEKGGGSVTATSPLPRWRCTKHPFIPS